jgi:hypothetical protein
MLRQFLFVLDAAVVLTLSVFVLTVVRNRLVLPKRVFHLVLAAFALRALTAVGVDSLGTFAGQYDFFEYDATLWTTAKLLREGMVTAPIYAAETHSWELFYIPYTMLYAPVYSVFGHHTLIIRFVFSLVGALFVLNVYRLGVELHDHSAGLYGAVFAAVFPYWLYLSTIFYRDMLIMLVLSQLLYVLVKWEQSPTVRGAVTALGVASVAVMLRPENILPIGVAFMLSGYILIKHTHPAAQVSFFTTATAAILSILVELQINVSRITVNTISKSRQYLARGGGAYLDTIVLTDWLTVVAYLPLGAVYFLLVPFPWQIHNTLALAALVQNLCAWYPAIVLAVPSIPILAWNRPNATLILVGFALSGVVSYGLIEGNMGPAMRHRSQFQIVFVVAAATTVAENVEFKLPTVARWSLS